MYFRYSSLPPHENPGSCTAAEETSEPCRCFLLVFFMLFFLHIATENPASGDICQAESVLVCGSTGPHWEWGLGAVLINTSWLSQMKNEGCLKLASPSFRLKTCSNVIKITAVAVRRIRRKNKGKDNKPRGCVNVA